MKRSRFVEEQIIGILRQAEAGVRVVDLCRQKGILDETFYKWRSTFGGMQVSDANRLRKLEEENARLKRIVGEQALDIVVLRMCSQKISEARSSRKSRAVRAEGEHGYAERRASVLPACMNYCAVKSAQFFLLEFPVFLSQDTSISLAKTIEGFDLAAFAKGTCRIHLPFLKASLCQDAICELWDDVKSRPGASMSLDGTSVTPEELKTVWRVHACGETYTSNLSCTPRQGWDWGCVFLAHIKPLENGKLLTPQALKQKLADIAERGWIHVCPHFHQDLVEEKVEQYFRSASALSEKWVEKEPSMMLPSGAAQQQTEPTQKIRPARYSDIGGLDKVVLALREAIELPLKHPEVLKHLGISPQRGCILCGPPGCGKTLLVRAVATESRATFIPVSGPELVTKWYGESEERLREVFQKAQEKQPAIIFFDEIDAIAQSRSASESLRLDSKFTTQLLTLMDGIYDMGMVFVLAAMNAFRKAFSLGDLLQQKKSISSREVKGINVTMQDFLKALKAVKHRLQLLGRCKFN